MVKPIRVFRALCARAKSHKDDTAYWIVRHLAEFGTVYIARQSPESWVMIHLDKLAKRGIVKSKRYYDSQAYSYCPIGRSE